MLCPPGRCGSEPGQSAHVLWWRQSVLDSYSDLPNGADFFKFTRQQRFKAANSLLASCAWNAQNTQMFVDVILLDNLHSHFHFLFLPSFLSAYSSWGHSWSSLPHFFMATKANLPVLKPPMSEQEPVVALLPVRGVRHRTSPHGASGTVSRDAVLFGRNLKCKKREGDTACYCQAPAAGECWEWMSPISRLQKYVLGQSKGTWIWLYQHVFCYSAGFFYVKWSKLDDMKILHHCNVLYTGFKVEMADAVTQMGSELW